MTFLEYRTNNYYKLAVVHSSFARIWLSTCFCNKKQQMKSFFECSCAFGKITATRSALMISYVECALTLHAGFQCSPNYSHKRDTAMYDFFSQERMLSGKRLVSASLAAPEGIADASSTESQRFRPSTPAEAVIRRVAAVLTTYRWHARTCTRHATKQCLQPDVLNVSRFDDCDGAKKMNTDKATHYEECHATRTVLQKPIQVVTLDLVCPKEFLTSSLRNSSIRRK